MAAITLLAIVLLTCVPFPCVNALNTERCSAALGMSSGALPEESISASSHYDQAVRAKYGRVNKEDGGGAWCPQAHVDDKGKEYLEIDFGHRHVITRTEVQGRFGNGLGKEFAEQYKLQYWRSSLARWVTYRDGYNNELLDGNTNPYKAVATILKPPITAARIRFIPFSHQPRTVCMRVEVYGCSYTDSLESYAMTDGAERGNTLLRDVTYDGASRGGQLEGGLGQLSDGETGHTNYRVDSLGEGRGYEWIGWKNDSGDPVEITFNFHELRNFSAVHINVNNLFTKDVQIFSRAKLFFSIGGNSYSNSVVFDSVPDKIFEHARNVTIDLQNIPATMVKLQLFFAVKWLMISEISFDSKSCNCNLSVEAGPMKIHEEIAAPSSLPATVETDTSQILIGSLATSGAVCCVLVGILIACNVKGHFINPGSKKKSTPSLIEKERTVSVTMHDFNLSMSSRDTVTGDGLLKSKVLNDELVMDKKRSVLYEEPYKGPIYNRGYHTLLANDIGEAKLNNSMLIEDPSGYAVPTIAIPQPPSLMEKCDTLPPPPLVERSHDPETLLLSNSNFPMTDIRGFHGGDVRGIVGSAILANADSATLSRDSVIAEIPRNEYQLLELIGESKFGRVHLCALKLSDSEGTYTNSTKVFINKSLKTNISLKHKEEFRNELKTLSQIEDVNIACLVGVVSGDPLSAFFQYSEYGDLHQFLRFHESNDEAIDGCPVLSYGARLYISSQIASGMKYYEGKKLVHRDLSARNCLVGENLQIKISDFAVTRSIYSSDYWNMDDRMLLPVRWMPPEAVLNGTFTTKSDVWSFGVTLWEVLTMARERPFAALSDAGALEHICRSCRAEGPLLLPRPPLACREMFEMMASCWRSAERQRPPFWEILLFLRRKNLGYILDYRE